MNIANEINYVASDPQKQSDSVGAGKGRNTGKVTVYRVKDANVTPEQIATAKKKRMDCVDCHNRPTHIYVPPDRSVDNALVNGRIDASLPYIKQQAVTALTGTYETEPQALNSISNDLADVLSGEISERLAGKAGDDPKRHPGSAADLQHHDLPGDEGGLASTSVEHRALLLDGMLPLPRRQSRERRKGR